MYTHTQKKKQGRANPEVHIVNQDTGILEPESGAHSEGDLHTEGTFAGTLVNVGDLLWNSGECQGGSCVYGVVGSPNFARLRQSYREGAHTLLVHPRACLRKCLIHGLHFTV